MMRRRMVMRTFAATAFASCSIVNAQSTARVYRVAMLYVAAPFSNAFTKRLQELGYEQSRNLRFEVAGSDVPLGQLSAVAQAMADRRPDVMVAAGSEAVLDAVERAAGATPIVMLFIDFDPVAKDRVVSLARPGRNLTGLSLQQIDLAAKKLELLKEAVPRATRIAVLFDDSTREQQRRAQEEAKPLGVTLLPQELRGDSYDYDGAIRAAVNDKAGAVLILSSGVFFSGRFKLFDAIDRARLPSMASPAFRDAGAMLCYGANFLYMYVRAAEIVDRILRGGQKPGDIPIEQPTRFQFIVNLNTARALAVSIPQSLLLRADEVIR